MPKLLLVEDNADLGSILKQYLEDNRFTVVWRKNGEEGLIAFKQDQFDLCVLDVMLPLKDGFTLARDIHALNDQMPFIFLTARNNKDDRIKGLKLNADDYITKPFDAEELVLRIQNILRRIQLPAEEGPIRIGRFIFEYKNLLLKEKDIKYKLTLQEAKLIRYLYEHRNNLVTREALLENIWGKNDYFLGRSMDVFITRLRKYFSSDKRIKIESTRGIGITFTVEEPE
ncbi:MAG TPA: response regulator transcription factor [Chitinophagaceae bacterium]